MAAVPHSINPRSREIISKSKVLVVGAGEIGCEVLKNLALSGFQDIVIIDLDTIDVSNLNRQFLFRKEHVGKPKAVVARESILAHNPDIKIVACYDSILSSDYGLNFFKRFNLVLNALDNRIARNHVNRMCLAADVPLIEPGTLGYFGQVDLIKKGVTQCYECSPKEAQKTFPGCGCGFLCGPSICYILLFGEANPDHQRLTQTLKLDHNAALQSYVCLYFRSYSKIPKRGVKENGWYIYHKYKTYFTKQAQTPTLFIYSVQTMTYPKKIKIFKNNKFL